MKEEYREYKSRRTPHKNTNKKSFGYLKKLFRQTVFSVVIFSVIISPELIGIKSGKYIKSLTKSALLYTIDTSGISKFFKDMYTESTHKGEEKNEKTETVTKTL